LCESAESLASGRPPGKRRQRGALWASLRGAAGRFYRVRRNSMA
jgi:hypothetical protein